MKSQTLTSIILLALIVNCTMSGVQTHVRTNEDQRPESSYPSLSRIDTVVNESIRRNETPGAVVLISHNGKTIYRKAFGHRALEPRREPMTLDTIFDLASLTKVIATATSIMILHERGRLSLSDKVARYIPEFAQAGKQNITIEHLMTHRSGLIVDNPLSDYSVAADAFNNIYKLTPQNEPGTRFLYSDVGYIVAAEIIHRMSGQTLDQFADQNIFKPLRMRDTFFKFPDTSFLSRIALTERRDGRWRRGEVHDPRAHLLGGVAGHAGLFSTVDDLAIFCRMILGGGSINGVRVLSEASVKRMTTSSTLPPRQLRGIGWDIDTEFSTPRGALFPTGSFGHTGFTGTSIWIDPASKTFVILLTNRVHPSGRGDVRQLRSAVATLAAESLMANALTGVDVLERDGFRQLSGRRIGLITNHTGLTRDGRSTIDVLAAAPNLKLIALFSPEHGIRGAADDRVNDERDEKTGLPVYSLYAGNRRRPTTEMLNGIDTLVFDIQDIGTRFYTYISTCGYAMEEAARHRLRFVVLDRPNPINGVDIEGPISDPEFNGGFNSLFSMPVRHGMTCGEIATMFRSERKLDLELTVVKMESWRRADYLDATGLKWVNPSPNMRSLTQATLYPGIGLLETTNLSVGRGTTTPFELVGAPWIDGDRLARALNNARLPGVQFRAVRFRPDSSKYANEECSGINIVITDRNNFRPVLTGFEIAYQLRRMYRSIWEAEDYLRLLSNRRVHEALLANRNATVLSSIGAADLEGFKKRRKDFLLY